MKKFALKTAAVLLGLAPLVLADATPDTATPTPTDSNCCTRDGSCMSPCSKDDKGIKCGKQEWLDIETVTIEAANGDPIAQYTVAYLTETDGEPTDTDKEKAREWYAKSVPGLEKAAAEGFVYPEEVQLQYESAMASLKSMAASSGLSEDAYLTNMFGDIPFYFKPVLTMEDQDEISKLGRMPARETRDSVIIDLLDIAPLAPQTRTGDNQGARAGAALAYMVIAKCAMWNAVDDPSYWDTALEALEAIESIYQDFSQYDYQYNVLFRNKNTPESIFEVQHMYQQGGIEYYSNLAPRCIPTPMQIIDEKPYFDGVLIEELGINANVNTVIRPNAYFVAQQSRGSRDIRANVNMAWGYGGKDFKNATETKPYLGPKFWCPNIQYNMDGNNYKVFRYADAILMKAECLHAKNDFANALVYLNKTRTRAGLTAFTDESPQGIIDEIMIERAKELFGEFQRKFDLVRWGVFSDKVKETTDYAPVRKAILPCHRYYPIPDSEVAKSKYILDNKEYEEYGF